MERDYCLYVSRQQREDDPPRSPISIEDLEPLVTADADFDWVSKQEEGAKSVPGARGFVISFKGDPCVEGDGLTFGVAEASVELTIKLIRMAKALDATVFDGHDRLDVETKKGFFSSKETIVATDARGRSA